METDSNARLIALVATVLIATGLFLFIYLAPITISASDKSQKEKSEIVLAPVEEEEEFIDIIEPVADPTPVNDQPADAHLDEPVHNEAQAAPASGVDLRNSGQQGEKPPVVKSKEPSPAKEKEEPKPQKPTGQAEKPKTDEREETRRKATSDVANVFGKGKSNATTSNTSDNGNSGSPSNSSSSTYGSHSGKIGGGWVIPNYGKVKSTVTGSVDVTVKIDRTGRVISVAVTGGKAPAATNPQVKAAVEREIRAHKFTRASYDDAEPATAYITYTFK